MGRLLALLALLATGCDFLQWQALRAYMAANPHLEREDGPTRYSTRHEVLRLEPVRDDFEFPWDLAFPAEDEALVTEKPGRLWRVDLRSGERRPVAGVPEVAFVGQGGLLGVELDPDFPANRRVYLSYTVEGPESHYTTRLARARLEGDALLGLEVLFTVEPPFPTVIHFGGALEFDREGLLYLSVGDRQNRALAQDPGSAVGKILRLHADGRPPEDNPFAGGPGAAAAVYSLGHRNPQGLALHPETGGLWSSEHGPRGGDEVNAIRPGQNYGWPIISHGEEYEGGPVGVGTRREGLEQPVHYWVPSIATAGIGFYSGDALPSWKGNLFVGGLIGTQLCRLALEDGRVTESEPLFSDLWHRVRAVRESPGRVLYVLTETGSLFRVSPDRDPAPPDQSV